MFRKFVIMSVFIIFILVACAGIESKYNTNITKARMPVRLQPSDTLISFVIEGVTFASWQKTVLTNAENLARRYNLTFDLATFAEHLNKKNKDAWKIYEDNQDVFEIIAGGFNNVNPVEPKRTGEFYDISIKKQIPYDLQEQKIKDMKAIFEKIDIKPAMQVFLVPYFAGDENTILIAEKYGYKLIIQQNIGKKDELIRNYNTITASKCYVNIPNRVNITDKDLEYIKRVMQNYVDKRIKRIYIILHPVNFNTAEAVSYTEKMINEISFRFKTANVFYGMILDGVM